MSQYCMKTAKTDDINVSVDSVTFIITVLWVGAMDTACSFFGLLCSPK